MGTNSPDLARHSTTLKAENGVDLAHGTQIQRGDCERSSTAVMARPQPLFENEEDLAQALDVCVVESSMLT